MKKSIFFLLLLLFPLFLFSQSIQNNSRSIGLKLAYSGIEGLMSELNYSHPIKDKYFAMARIKSRSNNYLGLALGGGRIFRVTDWMDLRLGLEYEYGQGFANRYKEKRENSHNLMLPVELHFHLGKRFTINAGFSPRINLNGVENESKLFYGGRIGFGFKF